MVVVLFQTKVRPDVDQEQLQRAFEHMIELVSGMRGYENFEVFTGEDGRSALICRFDSDEAVQTWKRHPEHMRTQQRKAEFFDALEITVAEVLRHSVWSSAAGATTA